MPIEFKINGENWIYSEGTGYPKMNKHEAIKYWDKLIKPFHIAEHDTESYNKCGVNVDGMKEDFSGFIYQALEQIEEDTIKRCIEAINSFEANDFSGLDYIVGFNNCKDKIIDSLNKMLEE
jgi:hypothetical protein